MIRHHVLWTLAAQDPAERDAAVADVRAKLEGLRGRIPGMSSIRVSTDIRVSPGNWDIMLVSEHDSAEALAEYQAHPDHVVASSSIKRHFAARACVDIEL